MRESLGSGGVELSGSKKAKIEMNNNYIDDPKGEGDCICCSIIIKTTTLRRFCVLTKTKVHLGKKLS